MEFLSGRFLVESLASEDGPQPIDYPVCFLDFGIQLKEQVHTFLLLLTIFLCLYCMRIVTKEPLRLYVTFPEIG